MSITVHCDDCGKGYRLGDDKAGKRFRCRECNSIVNVPMDDDFDDPWDMGADDDDDDWGAAALPGSSAAGTRRVTSTKRKSKKKTKSGSNNTPLIIGGVVGAVVLIGLIVGAFWLFSGGEVADGTPDGFKPDTAARLPESQQLESSYIPGNTMFAVTAKPARVLKSPLFKNVPPEIFAQAAGANEVAPDQIEQVTLIFTGPTEETVDDMIKVINDGPDSVSEEDSEAAGREFAEKSMGFVIKAKDASAVQEILSSIKQQGKVSDTFSIEGKEATRLSLTTSDGFPMERMAVVQADETTVLFASKEILSLMLSTNEKTTGPVVEQFRQTSQDSDLAILLSIESQTRLRDAILARFDEERSRGKGDYLPPEAETFIRGFKATSLVLDLSAAANNPLLTFKLFGQDDAAATEMKTTIDQLKNGVPMLEMMLQGQISSTQDPSQKTLLEKALQMVRSLSITQEGEKITVAVNSPGLDNVGDAVGGLIGSAMMGMGGGNPFGGGGNGFTPPGGGGSPFGSPFGRARGAAGKAAQKNQMKQIGLAMHNFHDSHRKFPTNGFASDEMKDSDGNMKVSWRVALLPYLEEQPLFHSMDMTKGANDSPNFDKVGQMPSVYDFGNGGTSMTRVRVFSGPGTIFDQKNPASSIRDIRDGTSNTILAVVAGPDKVVPWIENTPLTFYPDDPERTKRELGNIEGSFLALMADGSVRDISATIDAEEFSKLLTAAGGEVIGQSSPRRPSRPTPPSQERGATPDMDGPDGRRPAGNRPEMEPGRPGGRAFGERPEAEPAPGGGRAFGGRPQEEPAPGGGRRFGGPPIEEGPAAGEAPARGGARGEIPQEGPAGAEPAPAAPRR